MILWEAHIATRNDEEEKEGEDEVAGTPAYKKKARLKQGNMGGIQKKNEDNASTIQKSAGSGTAMSTAINNDNEDDERDDTIEELDKQE